MPSPAIQRRFNVWIATVVAIALLPFAWLAVPSPAWPRWSFALGVTFAALDALLMVLILSTPRDALRLTPVRSLQWITLLTAWLAGVTWLCVNHTPFGVLAVLGIAVAAIALARAFFRFGKTPWWAAVILWHPAALGPLALPLWRVAILALIAAAILTAFLRFPRRLAAP